ncbi:MAG: hypothetical protein ABIJ40_04545 [Bacteroidota bacterium]
MSNFLDQHKTQIEWLLKGDASIRYQTKRDLLNKSPISLRAERERINLTGWGKRLLDLQDKSGTWANGIYNPKWISTFYTLLLLKRLNALPTDNILKACGIIFDEGFYSDGGINVSVSIKHSDVCVTGMFLSTICHFGIRDSRIPKMIEYLLSKRMIDGGWNCSIYIGAVHGSFHTTISVLEGLWEYKRSKFAIQSTEIEKAQTDGIDFLLKHKLYKSDKTGRIIKNDFTKFSFPPRWKYDVLRGLDFFQEIQFEKDDRLKDAIDLLISKQTKEGFWKLQNKHTGKVFFELEKVGEPSRWNTLRALRVLKWWSS